jgi:hypothetical protein
MCVYNEETSICTKREILYAPELYTIFDGILEDVADNKGRVPSVTYEIEVNIDA